MADAALPVRGASTYKQRNGRDYVGHMPLGPAPKFPGAGSPQDEIETYQVEHKAWRKAYNSCARCETDEFTEVQNFDRMWGDGDLVCTKCGGYVRGIDTG